MERGEIALGIHYNNRLRDIGRSLDRNPNWRVTLPLGENQHIVVVMRI